MSFFGFLIFRCHFNVSVQNINIYCKNILETIPKNINIGMKIMQYNYTLGMIIKFIIFNRKSQKSNGYKSTYFWNCKHSEIEKHMPLLKGASPCAWDVKI